MGYKEYIGIGFAGFGNVDGIGFICGDLCRVTTTYEYPLVIPISANKENNNTKLLIL
jgi:hypothetical protein